MPQPKWMADAEISMLTMTNKTVCHDEPKFLCKILQVSVECISMGHTLCTL